MSRVSRAHAAAARKGWETRRANQGVRTAQNSASSDLSSTSFGPTYEAGSHSRRTLAWRAPTTSPNHAVLANLTTLRARSRAAVRNDGYAKSIIDKLVTNIV